MAFNVHMIPEVVRTRATLCFWMKHGFQETYFFTDPSSFIPPLLNSMPSSEVPGSNDPILLERLLDLLDPELKGHALFELRKKREMFPDLAPLLWYSFGTIAALIQEIVRIYPALSSPTLTLAASTRVCNVLSLFQYIASQPETRSPFIKAHIPSYLYPFLCTIDKAQPFEHLRLATLGVIGALVKDENTEATMYLLQCETIPLCLEIMKIGNEPSKTVSTFILLKVLLNDEVGLPYCCDGPFYAIAFALQKMVSSPDDRPSARLLKYIIRCYLRLSDHPRGHAVFKTGLPGMLQDGTFSDYLMKDPSTQECVQQLLAKLEVGSPNQVAPFSPLQ